MKGDAGIGRNPANILVVDDVAANLQVLSGMLEDRGYVTRPVTSGKMALQAAQNDPPDLVLLDITMPGMDGYEVCARLKADEKLKDIPVIFISAHHEALDKVKGFGVGAADYVTKPFQFEEVQARVETHLKLRHLQIEHETHDLELHCAYLELRKAWEASDRLLLSIFPKPIADRLKTDTGVIAENYPDASILHATIHDFDTIISTKQPAEVVELLRRIFSTFDALADKHGIEKLKTIGETYVAVSGLPVPKPDHVQAVAEFALEIQRQMAEVDLGVSEPIQLRIGIGVGPVVAGVIGTAKLAYDAWGAAVSRATQLAAFGIPGAVQVGEEVYQRLESQYYFEQRGEFYLAGHGNVRTYLLTGRK